MARSILTIVAMLAVANLHVGCVSREAKPGKARIVSLNDFASTDASTESTAPNPQTPARIADKPVATTQPQRNEPTATRRSVDDVADLKPGTVVVIDRVVGQVSGRPIFADAILEPLADLLRQEAARLPPREFEMLAAQRVNDRLNEVILTELFIAEAEASLTEDQQKGLLALMRDFQERKLAEQRGSRSLLEKELGLEGMTPEQLLELKRNEYLIINLINEKIAPRVIVSWRDIEREYERRKAEFMPQGRVAFRRIRVSSADTAAIEQIKAKLASGVPFAAVATEAGMPDGGTWETFTMNSDDVSDIEIIDAYKPYLKGLAEGQTTAPIDREGRTQWFHVDRIERTGGKSLYDVQRQLANDLYVRRNAEERRRYVDSLFSKGIYSQLEEMSRRVIAVALMRYGRQS